MYELRGGSSGSSGTSDVLDTLTEAEERDCENRLVILLDYDKFELIRRLLKHRWRIAVCTRLAQAQSEAAKQALLRESGESKGGVNKEMSKKCLGSV